jgi:hypothetical protein
VLSHNLQRRSGAGQLGFQTLVTATDAFQLDLLWGALGCPALGGQAGQHPGLPGSTPLHDGGGVQAFAAQQRALVTRLGEPVVLGQDRQLGTRGLNLRRRGRAGVMVGHVAIM